MCQWIIATRDENLVPTHIDSPRQGSARAATSTVARPRTYKYSNKCLGTFTTPENSGLQECDRLVRGNLESASTLGARQHVVDPHHIIPKLPIHFTVIRIGTTGRLLFLQTPNPPHLVLRSMPALRARVRSRLQFLTLIEEIPFVT